MNWVQPMPYTVTYGYRLLTQQKYFVKSILT